MAVIPAGHSLRGGDAFFNDMLRANRQAEIIVIDRDHETAGGEACTVLQLQPNQYTPITVQGHSAREYGNHVTVVGADLREVDLEEWLEWGREAYGDYGVPYALYMWEKFEKQIQ